MVANNAFEDFRRPAERAKSLAIFGRGARLQPDAPVS